MVCGVISDALKSEILGSIKLVTGLSQIYPSFCWVETNYDSKQLGPMLEILENFYV